MHDPENKQLLAQEIQKELNKEGLSRRAFLDRLKVLGAGFGATFLQGVRDADAAIRPDTVVNLKSTNPVLNNIAEEAIDPVDDVRVGADGDTARVKTAAWVHDPSYSRGRSTPGVYSREYGPVEPTTQMYTRGGYTRLYYRAPYSRSPPSVYDLS